MIPNTPTAIGFLAQRLMTHVLPDLRTNFGVADVALLHTLIAMVAQDFDRAAQSRVEDIHEMRALFAEAEALLSDRHAIQRIHDARAWALDDLRVSRLDEIHAVHAHLLIDVHARIESNASTDARALDAKIWAYYERHAERHRYDVMA